MATNGGPKIIHNGMDNMLDPSNRKLTPSAIDTNILDYSTWVVGNTSATGFGRNGSTDENIIESGTGPFGEPATLWASRDNDTGSNSDGGWNSSNFDIDRSYMYRWSVWVKRPVVGNGYSYLGMYGKNSSGNNTGVYYRSSGTSTTNPYFIVPNYSTFTADQWYLLTGHCWPEGSGTGSDHADTGMWLPNGTKHANSRDFVWKSDAAKSIHRSYLYYSTDTSTVKLWAYPRVDKIDGTEPSLESLLNGHSTKIKDPKHRSSNVYLKNNLRLKEKKSLGVNHKINTFEFDGTDDYIKIEGGTHTSLQRSIELVFKVNSMQGSYMPIATYTRSNGIDYGKRIWLGIQSNKFQMHGWGTSDPASSTTVTDGSYYHAVYAYDQSTAKHYIWINGTLENNSTDSQNGMSSWSNSSTLNWFIGRDPQASTWTSSASEFFDGEVGLFRTYNKILSTREVLNNYKSIRKRFDI